MLAVRTYASVAASVPKLVRERGQAPQLGAQQVLRAQRTANGCGHLWLQGLNPDFQLQGGRRKVAQALFDCRRKMIRHHLEMGMEGRLFGQKKIENGQGAALREVETAVNKLEGARPPLPQLLQGSEKFV